MKALSFGEILWDVYPDKKCLGGAPLNFAAHFAKQGGESYMLSALGNDELGISALRKLSAWKVNAEYVSILNDSPTGCCMVTLNEQSVPAYDLLQNVAYDHIPFKNISDNFDLLYFGTLALRSVDNLAVLKRLITEKHFSQIMVDINIRAPFSSRASVQFSVKNATVLKVSAEELPIVAEFLGSSPLTNYMDFSRELAQQYNNLKCILITRGADGAYALDCKTGKEYSCPAVKSRVLSTVGAGDSFAATFIYGFLRQRDMQYCLNSAAQVAGYVVSKYEAVPD
ncbi:MAG: PfkB family carbohydrate kinase [Acutalibacteraceae bacterium]